MSVTSTVDRSSAGPREGPLSSRLREVAGVWAHSQHQLVVLAADFADSDEWILAGSPTPAHWLAAVADVETCTAREWIRIGRCLQVLGASADSFAAGEISYAKMRALTPKGRALPTLAQQHADAIEELLADGSGSIDTEVVVHVRGDGCTLDDGTPIPDSVVEHIAPTSFLRALIHDAHTRPVNASGRRRHPTTRQQRVVKERDRACVDCGREIIHHYDHHPPHQQTGRTVTDELELRCAPCHRARHRK